MNTWYVQAGIEQSEWQPSKQKHATYEDYERYSSGDKYVVLEGRLDEQKVHGGKFWMVWGMFHQTDAFNEHFADGHCFSTPELAMKQADEWIAKFEAVRAFL